MKQRTISLVTVCMNRLHHLQQTLPRNMSDNEGYEHLEFVVLDYNSTDGLGEWINSHMKAYIDNGRLQYYHTLEPACYHPAHSRNMAFLLSTGQLVCNVDADNYSGRHFAAYLNNRFCENEKSVLITFGGSRQLAPKDAYGRVCITRDDFIAVNGYDECIDLYCGEDIDLAKRVMRLGRETVVIEESAFLHTIAHNDTERIRQMPLLKMIAACYLMPEANGFSRVLFLFFNGRFVLVTLRGHGQRTPGWQDAVDEGQYVADAGGLQLFFEQDFTWQLRSGESRQILSFSSDKFTRFFYQVTADDGLSSWAIQYMLRHIKTHHFDNRKVNTSGFGHGTVFHNFDYSHPLPVSPAINSVTNE
ncbi:MULTISPECIES: glycosyltransferase family 2 protein [Niastella]|uniref:Glycosyltransferase family 2 protein n=1 Tax=Niastella soli TaxID=2821487 RepID=A0ABS3YYG0_9BACT|nr:glycosyltransferase family A protein [Niastella soli]MBO9202542.1 glycosyltransferase family 2 protein [Niastella soli]